MPRPSKIYVEPWVEFRADRIQDPIRRLRYLRATAQLTPRKHRSRAGLRLAAILLTAVVASSCFLLRARMTVAPLPEFALRTAPPPAPGFESVPEVWAVEQNHDFETYSNGLRIDTRRAVENHPRSFHRFTPPPSEQVPGEPETRPVGIVFHTTESQQVPFEPDRRAALKQIGESLVEYVRRHRSYNYLIDRFGRVHRIVEELHAANHAGNSVWADDHWVYLGLNDSFLGVSLETRTEPGQEAHTITPAQVRSAAMLVEMLRSRYQIAAANCVTHAQVSVNPSNMRIGWHTDWASAFPFEQVGLPNNYDRPLAAISAFGFEYDATFLQWAGTRLYRGVEAADDRLRTDAASHALSITAYRALLRRHYRDRLPRPEPAGTEGSETASP
jgi:hypothetical protein